MTTKETFRAYVKQQKVTEQNLAKRVAYQRVHQLLYEHTENLVHVREILSVWIADGSAGMVSAQVRGAFWENVRVEVYMHLLNVLDGVTTVQFPLSVPEGQTLWDTEVKG